MSVNTAVEIDLYGQVNGEFINGHQYSGSGGQFDFVKGAWFSRSGKSFIGLKSSAKNGTISSIVPHVHCGRGHAHGRGAHRNGIWHGEPAMPIDAGTRLSPDFHCASELPRRADQAREIHQPDRR
jgi:hypothetical protein